MRRKVLICVSVGVLVVATILWSANRIGYIDVSQFPCFKPDLPKPQWYVSIHRGSVLIFKVRFDDSPFAYDTPEFPGFGFHKTTGNQLKAIWFPTWPVIVILAIYPTTAFIRGPYRRHRRRKKGLCLKCGYNLQGNVSGVCPECGERIGQR